MLGIKNLVVCRMDKVPVFMEFTFLVVEGKAEFVTRRMINSVRSLRPSGEGWNWDPGTCGVLSAVGDRRARYTSCCKIDWVPCDGSVNMTHD